MSTANITTPAGWPVIQLVSKDRIGEVYTPFAPSVFKGNGNEPRKGVLFAVPDDVCSQIEKIEAWAKTALKGEVPNVEALWHSSVRPAGNFPASLKAKVNVMGPHACMFVDLNGGLTDFPENWNRLPVVPVIEFRGIYSQKTGCGLILEASVMMVGEASKATDIQFT